MPICIMFMLTRSLNVGLCTRLMRTTTPYLLVQLLALYSANSDTNTRPAVCLAVGLVVPIAEVTAMKIAPPARKCAFRSWHVVKKKLSPKDASGACI